MNTLGKIQIEFLAFADDNEPLNQHAAKRPTGLIGR
jgi:hypothetical protein